MKKIFYFNIPSPSGNAGDDVLALGTMKKMEELFGRVKWTTFPVRNYVPPAVIDKANEHDFVLIGGHGLIISDTNSNEISGWQWRCSLENLKKLTTPIVFYAVGYNMMEGQTSLNEFFNPHIKLVQEKSRFFSVRNQTSRKKLAEHGLDVDRILVQHCPSIFLKSDRVLEVDNIRPRIAVNLAGDRMGLRVKDYATFESEVEKCLLELNKECQICFVNHNWNPDSNCQKIIKKIIPLLNDPHVYDIETIWNYSDVEDVLALYKSMDLVLAMRGHAQMIAWGQGIPVVSLISHNKLRWFLEDVSMLDTGIEITNQKFSGQAIEKVEYWLQNRDEWDLRQQQAYGLIQENFNKNNDFIKEIF